MQGYHSYVPEIRTRASGIARIEPLFRGYAFVRVVERWYPIKWTMGVVRVLMAGEHPARLADHEVDKLRRAEVGGFVRLPKAKPNDPIRIGQRVRVTTGSFRGHLALYDGQSPQQRIRVLLDLLGRQVRVELAAGDQISPVLASRDVPSY